MIIIAGCKKENPEKDNTDTPVFAQLPDSVMFVSTLDTITKSNLGTTIYVLNASTGSLITKYHYPYHQNTTWSYPAAGNGFLYSLENKKINAINMNTGEVLWTDTVDNLTVPVLHDDTFYGVYRENNTSYAVYALDAKKPSNDYIWKYKLTRLPLTFPPGVDNPPLYPIIKYDVRYYNGTIYITADKIHLVALDAITGVLKWEISTNNTALYSLAALNKGVIIAGKDVIDAASGTKIWSASPANVPLVPGTQTVQAEIAYATIELYFVKTYHFNTPESTSFLSAVDRATGEDVWTINFGGGYSSWDTVNTVEKVWNNQLIVKNGIKSSSKYGTNIAENFRLLNIGSGSIKLSFDDIGKGNDLESFIVNNTMYFHKANNNLGPFYSPPVNYLYAIDLFTGKQKWNNDKLLAGYSGSVFSCVFAAGKGFSPFIQ
ncbi:outer membrane protein assembly factor BamB [Pedobacter sp. CAN_A7]|uniref:outer membrane protein assembly factor BamB family protein n=1 Tax=Pedobacter sp. CAN_A7 TaxID=2787722 RepID=UPI0018CB7E7F